MRDAWGRLEALCDDAVKNCLSRSGGGEFEQVAPRQSQTTNVIHSQSI
jgi:hypothetical protein